MGIRCIAELLLSSTYQHLIIAIDLKQQGGPCGRLQEFMKVYDALREELMSDELIAGQPSFSAEYMRKVSSALHCQSIALQTQ